MRLPSLQALLAIPAAPLAGARLSYQVNHPPRLPPSRDPASSRLTPVELAVPVPGHDGTLHAWLFPGDPSRVVALGHAIGGEKSRSLSYARFLTAAGHTVVLFDFRNHGQSFNDRSLTGYSGRFADDLRAVVAHVQAIPEYAEARWALYGLSMSSFAVIHALGRISRVAAVVCDSGPTAHPARAIGNLVRLGRLPIPEQLRDRPARSILEAVFRPLAAVSMRAPRPWPPRPGRPEYDIPMLFLVGDRDDVVSPDDVRALADPFARSEMHMVKGAGHLRLMSADREGYQARVLEFLAKSLGEPGSVAQCASD